MSESNDHRPQASPGMQPSPHPGAPEWNAPPTIGDSSPAPAHAAPPPLASATPPPVHHAAPGAGTAPTFRSWQPGILALRPLTFGDFLGAPFKAMRFNRAVVIGGPLLFTLASAALSVTALWLLFNDPAVGITNPAASLSASSINPETVIIGILALISLLLADVLSSTIVAPGVARAVLGEQISLAGAWTQVRKKFGHILLLYVLTALGLTVVIVLAAIPLILAIASGEAAWIAIGVALALLVMAPTGFVVALITGLARPIIVLEQIGAIAALGRAWRLMKGRFWWSVLIVFVTSVLIYIATSILQTGGQFIALLASAISPENPAVALISFFVVYGLAIVVSSVVTYTFMGSVFALMYIDMRMRHEGFDLDLARAAEARGRR